MQRFAWFKWQALFADWEIIAKGLGQTVSTSVLALALALALGTLFGTLGTAPWRPARLVNLVYVDLFQNIPLVTVAMFLFYGVPHLLPETMHPEAYTIGVAGLGIYHGAYIAEVVRAGVQSIHRGQLEAAFSQGFTYVQAMRHVILPQAAQVVLPPLANQAVSLLKNSAILAMISGGDLMFHVDSWSASTGYYGPAYLVAWVLYFGLCFSLATWARRLEERAARARGQEVRVA